jgi:HD superfamily phosphodiesterase
MNRVIEIKAVESFVQSDYADRDIMHNLAHIYRLRELAQEIASNYEHDPRLLELGAYFHGTIAHNSLGAD